MQNLSAPAIVCGTRPHGETAVIARLLTREHGMYAAYLAGGRGRQLRPVLVPGNLVAAEFSSRSESQLPFARLELVESRGPWLGEPLAAAAINWATALAATALPERQPYPALHEALSALLDAVCHAPSARGWAAALAGYEALLLRELGYGTPDPRPAPDDFAAILGALDHLGPLLSRYVLAERRSGVKGADIMAARAILRDRLGKIAP
ncbi:MAG: recombination protein O N-terminal domain-containing protein [Novosphingobium sp.]